MPPRTTQPAVSSKSVSKTAPASHSALPPLVPKEKERARAPFWGATRLMIMFVCGLLGVWMIHLSAFLNDADRGTVTTFLHGQLCLWGWSNDEYLNGGTHLGVLEMLKSFTFWKMLIGFILGTGAGFAIALEIPKPHLSRANTAAKGAALFVLTLLVFSPAMTAGFIWDDDQEITANPSIQGSAFGRPGFDAATFGLWEIWTGGLSNPHPTADPATDPLLVKALRPPLHKIEQALWVQKDHLPAHESADFFPLHATFTWLEWQLFGHDFHGRPLSSSFHIMNIIFHALDVILLWIVLCQLRVPGAWLGSLLFAIHPVHAESVAWIAESKNTQSLLFYLLCISAWIKMEDAYKPKKPFLEAWEARFADRNKASGVSPVFGFLQNEGLASREYLLAFVFCLCSLLCKTSVVVLPPVLLLLTWWRTGALTLRDFVRSIPFWILAVVLAEITIWFQNGRAIGQEVIPFTKEFAPHLGGAGLSLWWYVSKALVPVGLMTIYPRWPIIPPEPNVVVVTNGIAMMGVALALLAVLYFYRNKIGRTPFFVFAYFTGTLFPVLGFFKMSYMRLTLQADHFQYLSDISILAFAGAMIFKLWEMAGPKYRPLVLSCAVLLCGVFSASSWERAGFHQSEETLWRECLKRNDDSWQAHNHLGAVIYMKGNIKDSAYHFQRAVNLKPENPEVHNNLGLTLAATGHWDEALEQYRLAVKIKGDVPAMRRNLADCLSTLKKFDEAAEQYKIVLEADSRDPNSHVSYGYVLSQTGHLPEALEQFETALKIDPGNQRAQQNLQVVKNIMSHQVMIPSAPKME